MVQEGKNLRFGGHFVFAQCISLPRYLAIPSRQTAAQEPPSETTRKPSLVWQGPISAPATPSTPSERIESPSACGCLAESDYNSYDLSSIILKLDE